MRTYFLFIAAFQVIPTCVVSFSAPLLMDLETRKVVLKWSITLSQLFQSYFQQGHHHKECSALHMKPMCFSTSNIQVSYICPEHAWVSHEHRHGISKGNLYWYYIISSISSPWDWRKSRRQTKVWVLILSAFVFYVRKPIRIFSYQFAMDRVDTVLLPFISPNWRLCLVRIQLDWLEKYLLLLYMQTFQWCLQAMSIIYMLLLHDVQERADKLKLGYKAIEKSDVQAFIQQHCMKSIFHEIMLKQNGKCNRITICCYIIYCSLDLNSSYT